MGYRSITGRGEGGGVGVMLMVVDIHLGYLSS